MELSLDEKLFPKLHTLKVRKCPYLQIVKVRIPFIQLIDLSECPLLKLKNLECPLAAQLILSPTNEKELFDAIEMAENF